MKKKGFTLVELLAVITILGVVTLIAVPSFKKVILKLQRKQCEADRESIKDLIQADIIDKQYKGGTIITGEHKIEELGISSIDNKYGKHKEKKVTITPEVVKGVTEYIITFPSDFCS